MLAFSCLQRLVHYVDNALLRWAARTGHYEAVASIAQPGTPSSSGGGSNDSSSDNSSGSSSSDDAATGAAEPGPAENEVPAGGEVLRL